MDLIANTLPDELPRYRQALGSFLTGITVVTTIDSAGNDRGVTANSFTSVSLDPPLVLFCIDKRAASYDAFTTSGGYAIHILGSDQQDVAKNFASKSPRKFAGLTLRRSATGVPILESAHTVLDCLPHQVIDAGDHAVIIARVAAFAIEDKRPLGFYQGKMQSFSTEDEIALSAGPTGSTLRVLWLVETLGGDVVLRRGDAGSVLPSACLAAHDLYDAKLSESASHTIGATVVIDFLFSVYGSPDGSLTHVYRGRANPSDEGVMHLRAHHELVPADEAVSRIADVTEAAVLTRYVNERGDSTFGIYAGSIDTGSVATIDGTVAPRPL